jgi:hypothetical protein
MSVIDIVIEQNANKHNDKALTVRRLNDRNSNQKEHRKGFYG